MLTNPPHPQPVAFLAEAHTPQTTAATLVALDHTAMTLLTAALHHCQQRRPSAALTEPMRLLMAMLSQT